MPYEFQRNGEPRPCLVLNPQPPTSVMTVPIVGVPRGGTTMVAAVVHALGVDLGPAKDLAQFTFEDQEMKNESHFQMAYIARRNHERSIWGWKDPPALTAMRPLFFCLRSPRVIIVCRDMAASIDGEMRFDEALHPDPENRRPFSDLATATANWWADNMEFVEKTALPTLLVSYERAMQMPEKFIRDLAAFLGIAPTHEMTQDALARINPHGGYLRMDEQGQPVKVVEPLPAEIAAPVVEAPPAEPAPELPPEPAA